MAAFKLGKNLATTPGKVIFQNDLCQLIQYAQKTREAYASARCSSSRPGSTSSTCSTSTPEKSLIRWLVEQGHTVFVVSWVNPDARHADKSFEHYMTEGILAALDVIEKATGEQQGQRRRLLRRRHAAGDHARLSARPATKGRIASATLLTTQVDFEFSGDLKVFADADHVASVEAEMKRTGYLEGSKMATAFNLLRSNDLIWPYVVNDYLKGKEPLPFDLLYWNADATRMPCANHSFYLRNCYLENNSTKGRVTIAGRKIDLSEDHAARSTIWRRAKTTSRRRSRCSSAAPSFGGPVRFVLTGSGHIAGVVNPPARRKYQVPGPTARRLARWRIG